MISTAKPKKMKIKKLKFNVKNRRKNRKLAKNVNQDYSLDKFLTKYSATSNL